MVEFSWAMLVSRRDTPEKCMGLEDDMSFLGWDISRGDLLVLGSVWDTTLQPVLGEKSKMLDGYLNLFYMNMFLWSVGHVGLRGDNM